MTNRLIVGSEKNCLLVIIMTRRRGTRPRKLDEFTDGFRGFLVVSRATSSETHPSCYQSFVRLIVCLLVRWFVCSFLPSFAASLFCSFVGWFIRLLLASFIPVLLSCFVRPTVSSSLNSSILLSEIPAALASDDSGHLLPENDRLISRHSAPRPPTTLSPPPSTSPGEFMQMAISSLDAGISPRKLTYLLAGDGVPSRDKSR